MVIGNVIKGNGQLIVFQYDKRGERSCFTLLTHQVKTWKAVQAIIYKRSRLPCQPTNRLER